MITVELRSLSEGGVVNEAEGGNFSLSTLKKGFPFHSQFCAPGRV